MIYFLYTLAGCLCNYFSCVHLLSTKLSIQKRLGLLLYTFGIFFLFYRTLGQLSTFLTFFGFIFFIYYFVDNRNFNLSCYLFGYLYIVTFNYLFLWFVSLLLNMDTETLLNHDYLKLIFSFTYCIYCGATTKLLGWYLHKKLNISKYLNHDHLLIAITIDLFLLVFFYIFNFSYGEHLGYNYGVIALNGIIFLLLFAVTVSLMYSIYKITIKEQDTKHRIAQFESLRIYTEKLEQSYGIMRKFKHDYVNILSTMSGFINSNDMEGLMEYYGERVLPLSHAFTESDTKLGVLSNIKDPALKGILSSKFIYTMEIGIKTEIELTEPIDKLFMDSLDLSRILGIFLDNAVEASAESKEKEIRFCMFYRDGNLWIIVQNSSSPPSYPLFQLNNPGVSSKGENRGLGLYNVSMLLNKYNSISWNTTYEEPYFTQELILSDNQP